MRSRSCLAFAGASLIWGSEWLLAPSLPPQPRLLALAVQYGIVALLLLLPALSRQFWRHGIRRLTVAIIAGVGLLAIPQLLIFSVASHLPQYLSLACLALVPVMFAVWGRLPIPLAVGGFAGVICLVGRTLTLSAAQAPWLFLPLAGAAVIAGALALAERQPRIFSIIEILFVQCTASSLLLWAAASCIESQSMAWSALSVAGLVGEAIVAVLAAYWLFYRLIASAGAVPVSTMQWSQPLVAAVESAVLFRVRPEWTEVVGMLLIVSSIAAIFRFRSSGGGVFLQITGD
jgi:drug/metabolite transporter (DMT)-like permease